VIKSVLKYIHFDALDGDQYGVELEIRALKSSNITLLVILHLLKWTHDAY